MFSLRNCIMTVVASMLVTIISFYCFAGPSFSEGKYVIGKTQYDLVFKRLSQEVGSVGAMNGLEEFKYTMKEPKNEVWYIFSKDTLTIHTYEDDVTTPYQIVNGYVQIICKNNRKIYIGYFSKDYKIFWYEANSPEGIIAFDREN